MNFLLDTNVVSESFKPRPNPGVISWLAAADEDRVLISVGTLVEIRYGIDRLSAGPRKKRLNDWLQDDLPLRFGDRIVAVDSAVADIWGKIIARRDNAGKPIGSMDALIAATANVHELTLVTRHVSDFQYSVQNILNPWS